MESGRSCRCWRDIFLLFLSHMRRRKSPLLLLHFLRAVKPQSSTKEITLDSIDLLGDSIFDNQTYVNSGESVIEQISLISPVHVNLLAVDGDTTRYYLDILKQQVRSNNRSDLAALAGI